MYYDTKKSNRVLTYGFLCDKISFRKEGFRFSPYGFRTLRLSNFIKLCFVHLRIFECRQVSLYEKPVFFTFIYLKICRFVQRPLRQAVMQSVAVLFIVRRRQDFLYTLRMCRSVQRYRGTEAAATGGYAVCHSPVYCTAVPRFLGMCVFYNILLEVSAITDLMINQQIRDKEIRLIDSTGAQLGIMSAREAQRIADDKRLDLVKISPGAKPPVCKLMDYSKYKFDMQKKEKEARKKQKTVTLKEIRLSPNIDTHDVQVKVKNALKFLKDGNKLKVSIRFRGRELGRADMALGIMHDFAEQVSEYGTIDRQPKVEARTMSMFIVPKS